MLPALIRWHSEYAIPNSQPRKRSFKQLLELFGGKIAADASLGTKQAHAANSTFLSPGASVTRMRSATKYALEAMMNRLA